MASEIKKDPYHVLLRKRTALKRRQERVLQIVVTEKGRVHSSFNEFVLADYFLQMTKASSLNLIRATFNTTTEEHKFNLNQGWVFSTSSTYSAPSMLL